MSEFDNRNKLIGSFVKTCILHNISVTNAARKIGIGRPALSNFLNGKSALSENLAFKLEMEFDFNAKLFLLLQKYYAFVMKNDNESYEKQSVFLGCQCGHYITDTMLLCLAFDYGCSRCERKGTKRFKRMDFPISRVDVED
jgi:plasmid maintenance system antidote protein VapI